MGINEKHLEFLQSNISRMNTCSFQMKGWAITIVSALIAIYVATISNSCSGNTLFIFIAIAPTVLFFIQYPENEDLLVYTSLEFMFIFVCLLKRINNIERIKEYEYEVHDDYLAFSPKDYEFIQNISKYLNENDKS